MKPLVKIVNKLIKWGKQKNTNFATEITDGYHTFEELYDFRKHFNAALFNEWAKLNLYQVHKSKRHQDGELCFGGDWFIVLAMLPTGQISNHYKKEDWDLFKIEASEIPKFDYDRHTPTDVLERLSALYK